MGVALLDSNAVVGFLDADDPLHGPADRAIRAMATEHSFVVSVVTVAELLTGAKLGHHDETTVRGFFARVVSRRIPLDEPTAERAASSTPTPCSPPTKTCSKHRDSAAAS